MSSLPPELDLKALPKHVAIIMDGNGRWAQQNGLPRISGHAQGHYTVRRITDICGRLNIPYLTLYAFSAENWRRPEDEVNGLMSLIEHVAHDEIEALNDENVRFNIIGRMNELPDGLRAELERDMELTRANTGLTLTLAINYGGRTELVDAFRRMVAEGLSEAEITEEAVSQRLYTADMPDPDLLIRTAGELRVSNYLLWQIAYTEIYVTDTLWPAFGEEEFGKALLAFQRRTRKFGGVLS
ncbi:MAG TPA: isoprenyl transferase [Armatimonadota bacterium]|jgi:undecaprenyl diphosphate synthase